MKRVQSVRGVGCKRGYPYYAWGVYEPRQRGDGVWTYRLIRSGEWFRSDVSERLAFEGIPIVQRVRHGTIVPCKANMDLALIQNGEI